MTSPTEPQRIRHGAVRFEQVGKTFDMGIHQAPVEAIELVDLEVGPDEAVGVIGPNGAGKSTLLRLAAGITAPTEGRILRTGTTCAVIELGAGIHTDLTGRENIALLAELAGLDAARFRDRFDDIVEFSGLGEVLDRPTRTYSTGMVGRLSFSVAVHSSPDLLLLDEVLSIGDLAFQQQCRERLLELRSEGTTLLLVTHDLEFVAGICDRAALLVDGRIQMEGPVNRVVGRYLGLPEAGTPDPRLRAVVPNPRIEAGAPIPVDLHWELPNDEVSELRLDLVIREHPTFEAVGESIDVVFGSTPIPLPRSPDSRLEVSSAGVPTSRFEVVLSATLGSGEVVSTPGLPFALVGPTRPMAIHLPATLRTRAIEDRPAS